MKLIGNILTPTGWLYGSVQCARGRIAALTGEGQAPCNNTAPYIIPGFIDLHVHGGGNVDVMDLKTHADPKAAMAAMATITCTQAAYGTTSLLATTMTAPHAEIVSVLQALGTVCDQTQANGARVLGVHLEGPYISRKKLGAQPDAAVAALQTEVAQYLSLAPIKVLTLAPEIVGHMDIIRFLAERKVRVQLGHSLASYEQAVSALQHGASGFTHLFNAMSPLQHRAPGLVGAALAHAQYAEIIPDLLHVHPGAIRAALRAIPKLYVVTDSTSATGMPDGDYHLGSQKVTKCLGGMRLADGTLAGSALTMDQALRNLVGLGLPLSDVAQRLSTFAADYLGLTERGRIACGAFADLLVFGRDLHLQEIYIEGERFEPHLPR